MLPPGLAAWSPHFREQAAECRRQREALPPEQSELRHSLSVLERSWQMVEQNLRQIASIEQSLDLHRRLLASLKTVRAGAGASNGPIFHFNLISATYVSDDLGIEMPNLAAARRHAIEVARELLHNNPDKGASSWAIEVRDEKGEYLLTIPFSRLPP